MVTRIGTFLRFPRHVVVKLCQEYENLIDDGSHPRLPIHGARRLNQDCVGMQ